MGGGFVKYLSGITIFYRKGILIKHPREIVSIRIRKPNQRLQNKLTTGSTRVEYSTHGVVSEMARSPFPTVYKIHIKIIKKIFSVLPSIKNKVAYRVYK